jgi:peptidoglycan hydrolase CwlO-like protein
MSEAALALYEKYWDEIRVEKTNQEIIQELSEEKQELLQEKAQLSIEKAQLAAEKQAAENKAEQLAAEKSKLIELLKSQGIDVANS